MFIPRYPFASSPLLATARAASRTDAGELQGALLAREFGRQRLLA
jgi:hypothetical protein